MNEQLRILIADDEAETLEDLKELLEEMGHIVVARAHDGDEMLSHLRTHAPDLVITDIRMPGRDGLEIAAEIQNERPTPFVIVSAFKDDELMERAAACGAYGYLLKPIRPDDLEATIRLAMRRFSDVHPALSSSGGPSHWFG